MTKLIIKRGVPASGKSTDAELLRAAGAAVVNRDSIRFSTYGSYWGGHVDEDVVTEIEDAAIRANLQAGRDTVVDATNFRWKALQNKLSMASEVGAEVVFQDHPISLEEAVFRDANRDRSVGRKVIEGMFKRYHINVEGRSLPKPPPVFPTFEPYVPNPTKPWAYIVDTDGTLADCEGIRSPYDGSKVHLDRLIFHVAQTVWGLQNLGVRIIGLSGRDEEHRQVSLDWWKNTADIVPDEFLMRAHGDKRNDAIVKYELFKQHIEPNYHVMAAFDDRPRVIRMWRTIGVPVFDVGLGKEF